LDQTHQPQQQHIHHPLFCCGIGFHQTKSAWECGHILSEKNGGKTVLGNLIPVCSKCNKSMATKTVSQFLDEQVELGLGSYLFGKEQYQKWESTFSC